MQTYSGKKLEHMLERFRSEGVGQRFAIATLMDYLKQDPVSEVCLLYGLAHTGKKTMMAQAVKELQDYENTCWVQCGPYEQDDVGDIRYFLYQHPSYRYIFIEDAPNLEYVLDTAVIFYDRFVKAEGRHIVLCGDNSLLFHRMGWDDPVWDDKAGVWADWTNHVKRIQTTYVSFFEYSQLTGTDDKKHYIEYGGFLDDRLQAGSDAYEAYIAEEISKNIERTYETQRNGRNWGPLLVPYADGCLYEYIHYIIECAARTYLIRLFMEWQVSDGLWQRFHVYLVEFEEALHRLHGQRFERYSQAAAEEVRYVLQEMDIIRWYGEHDIPVFRVSSLCYHFIRRFFREVEAPQGADEGEWSRFMATVDEMVCKEMARDIELQS